MDNNTEQMNEVIETSTYHWSQIASPRYPAISLALLSGSVTLTQKVHLHNQTPKVTPAHPAFVIYDFTFLQYLVLTTFAPLVSSAMLDDDVLAGSDCETLCDAIMPQIIGLVSQSLESGISAFKSAERVADEVGVTLDNSSRTIIRAYKLNVARVYRKTLITPNESNNVPQDSSTAVSAD